VREVERRARELGAAELHCRYRRGGYAPVAFSIEIDFVWRFCVSVHGFLQPNWWFLARAVATESLGGGLYARLGWTPVATVEDRGDTVLVMAHKLAHDSPR
jgi:hypothetical protein